MNVAWASLLCGNDSNSEGEKENDLRDCTHGTKPNMPSATSQYANADNVEACCKYLTNCLAGLGFQSNQLNFFSNKAQDVAVVVNVMYALVQQRTADREARSQLEEALHKARFSLQVTQRERAKLEEELREKHTEIGNLEIKVRQARRTCNAANSEAASRHEQDSRRIRQASADAHQADVQVRQRDLEIERLKQQLTKALSKQRSGSAGTSPSEARTDGSVLPDSAALGDQSSDVTLKAASVSSKRLPKNNPAAAALELLQQQLSQAKKQLAQSEHRVADLMDEKQTLTARLRDLQHDFTQLLLRCESMHLGVSPSEVASQLAPKLAQAHEDVSKLSDAELQVYMATELKVVQDRCKQLLKIQANVTGTTASGVDAGTDSTSQLLQQLKDQDKALNRALAAARRADAQKDAAQQRANAASQRASLLEKRVTESCSTINNQQELIYKLQQQVQQAQHMVEVWQAQGLIRWAPEQPSPSQQQQQQLYMGLPLTPPACQNTSRPVPGAIAAAGVTTHMVAGEPAHSDRAAAEPQYVDTAHPHLRFAADASEVAPTAYIHAPSGTVLNDSCQPQWSCSTAAGQLGSGTGACGEAPRSRTPRRCWTLPRDDEGSPVPPH